MFFSFFSELSHVISVVSLCRPQPFGVVPMNVPRLLSLEHLQGTSMAGGGDGGSSEELSHARRLFGFVGDFMVIQ